MGLDIVSPCRFRNFFFWHQLGPRAGHYWEHPAVLPVAGVTRDHRKEGRHQRARGVYRYDLGGVVQAGQDITSPYERWNSKASQVWYCNLGLDPWLHNIMVLIETPSQPQQFFSELPHGATASFTSSLWFLPGTHRTKILMIWEIVNLIMAG